MTNQENQVWLPFIEQIELEIQPKFAEIDKIAEQNQWKVIRALQHHKLSDYHFLGSTGYGYNDVGRELLDQVYADVFDAEAALVRPHFASGTHTISTVLFGLLRPGDHLLYITGRPYETLHKVIGQKDDGMGSLADFGIMYDEVALLPNGEVDWELVEFKMCERTKVVGIQRSRGYEWRSSFTCNQISQFVERSKTIKSDVITFVDNCYGEFTELIEPIKAGVDIIAGSLIKNPGGGLAPTGGYITGKRQYVELASYRLTAPGIGADVGSMLQTTRTILQGLFLAPHFVGQALKGAVLTAAVYEKLGYEVQPRWNDQRSDIIQAIRFNDREQLIRFVQSIQRSAPVDAHFKPEPAHVPGYQHPVIMAAGTFVQGGSLELSADAPIRDPFIAFLQGGLTYAHVKLALLTSVRNASIPPPL